MSSNDPSNDFDHAAWLRKAYAPEWCGPDHEPRKTYRTVPRIEPARRLRPHELPSIQVGGTPITCQDNDLIVPPCAKCGKKLFFIMGCEPFHLHHDHGSKLSWGDCGEYLLFACPKCFAGGEPGTYYVEGNCF